MFIKNICIGPNFILIHVSGTEKDKYHVFLTILVNEEYPIIEPIDIVDPPTYSNMLHVTMTVPQPTRIRVSRALRK